MHKMMAIKDMLCDELDEYATKDQLNMDDLNTIDKLTHSIKSIETILAMKDYSYDYEPMNSYAPRRRDSMGRYSRDSYDQYAAPRYSYESGSMASTLKEMMNTATTEKERNAISRCIESLGY